MHLAIDTTTSKSILALDIDGQIIERRFEPKLTQRAIFAELSNLLNPDMLAGLSAITIGLGPGSFTGVKIGVIAAKTLAWSRAIPIAGVCSLDAVAAGIPVESGVTLVIAVPSTRGEAYVCRYKTQNENWVPIDRIVDVKLSNPSLEKVIPENDLLISGESAEMMADVLGEIKNLSMVDDDFRTPMASGLLKLGSVKHKSDQCDDPLTLLPMYVRESQPERLDREGAS